MKKMSNSDALFEKYKAFSLKSTESKKIVGGIIDTFGQYAPHACNDCDDGVLFP